jgi:hypothetical protein
LKNLKDKKKPFDSKCKVVKAKVISKDVGEGKNGARA